MYSAYRAGEDIELGMLVYMDDQGFVRKMPESIGVSTKQAKAGQFASVMLNGRIDGISIPQMPFYYFSGTQNPSIWQRIKRWLRGRNEGR